MRERRIGIRELEANLNTLLHEVRSGTTLVLTDRGHAVARLTAASGANDSEPSPTIAWSGRRLKKRKPKARLRGGGSMADRTHNVADTPRRRATRRSQAATSAASASARSPDGQLSDDAGPS